MQVTRATLAKRNNPPIDAELHDLSIYGCRFACRTRYREGDRLWLRFGDGLPIAAHMFNADEIAAGEIPHAIRFILPNELMRERIYVRPATHSTGATSGPAS